MRKIAIMPGDVMLLMKFATFDFDDDVYQSVGIAFI